MDKPNIRHKIIPIIWSSLNLDFGGIKPGHVQNVQLLILVLSAFTKFTTGFSKSPETVSFLSESTNL